MRPIFDLSPFLNQKVSVERYDGKGYVVYACGADKWIEKYWKHFHSEPRPVLYATFCSIMLWKEFRYIRRVHQPFLSIEYVMEGELWFRSGKRAFAAEKGDLCLLHRNRNHDYYFQPGKPTRLMTFVLHGSGLTPLLEQLHLDRTDVFSLNDDERMTEIFDRIKPFIHESLQDLRSGEINAGVCYELLQFLAHAHQPGPLPQDMCAIRDFLEESAAGPLKMAEVARRFHLSLPTLNRKFQQTFGMTPYHYRLEQRMQRAEELLMQTTLPIKEIAFRLGYTKPLYFSAEFRRLRGISPGSFRNDRR